MRTVLLVFLICLFSFSLAHAKTIGDFNDDGKVILQDAIAFVIHLSGKKTIPEIGFNIGDVIVRTVTDTLYLTAEGQRAATEFLWGWWTREWFHPDGRPMAGIYAFLQDGAIFYDEYVSNRKTYQNSGIYKYDSFTGYILVLWSDETEWVRPFGRFTGGDSLGTKPYRKVSAPPDWAK